MDPSTFPLVLAAIVFLLDLLIVVAGGVWIVARISGTTDKLGASIDYLGETVSGLKTWLEKVDDKHDDTVERLARVEEKLEQAKR